MILPYIYDPDALICFYSRNMSSKNFKFFMVHIKNITSISQMSLELIYNKHFTNFIHLDCLY